MYALDPSATDQVLRFGDLNGDAVPDSAFTVFLAGSSAEPIQAHGFRAPKANRIEIFHTHVHQGGMPYRRLDCLDSDGDGVADQVTEVGPLSDVPEGVFGDFLGRPVAGEGALKVQVNPRTTWRIEGDSGGAWTTLATFTGTNFHQQVTLSRALVADETIRLVEDASGESLADYVVPDVGATVVLHVAEVTVRTEGGTATITGKNFTGQESVQARVDDDSTPWQVCTISSSTSSSLTVVVPEFGLEAVQRAWLRVSAQGAAPDDYTDVMIIVVPD